MRRLLIFLDVDGTLIPFGGGPYPSYHTDSANPLLERLDPAHHGRDVLLHKVNPRVGLVAADYAALAEWGRRTRMAD